MCTLVFVYYIKPNIIKKICNEQTITLNVKIPQQTQFYSEKNVIYISFISKFKNNKKIVIGYCWKQIGQYFITCIMLQDVTHDILMTDSKRICTGFKFF
jgi:hypothetical protein